MKTMRPNVISSNRVVSGMRKSATSAFAQARSPHGVAELNRLIRSFDAKLDRAEREIDALLEHQASKRQ